AGAEDRQEVLAAVLRCPPHLDLALDDDVEAVSGVTFSEQNLPPRQPHLLHRSAQCDGGLVVQTLEQRSLPEYVVNHWVLSCQSGVRIDSASFALSDHPKCASSQRDHNGSVPPDHTPYVRTDDPSGSPAETGNSADRSQARQPGLG